jgi:hypothetical protein
MGRRLDETASFERVVETTITSEARILTYYVKRFTELHDLAVWLK